MKKIIFFEANIDEMGGVERIISTLANSLIEQYTIEVVSLYKTRKESFFEYKEGIKKIYLRNDLKSKKYKKTSLIYFIYKIVEKLYNNTILKMKKKSYAKSISENDVLIFGRISMAIEWIPKYINKNCNIILRDASHYYCHNSNEQVKIINILKNYIKLFIVSSDESKNIYLRMLNKNECRIEKIFNPLGIDVKRKFDFDSKKIIAVGRCDFQKGYNVLIKAFKLVNEKHKDWKLEIVGNYNDEITDIIKKLDLEKNIILTKEIKDIVAKLNESSIYVTTSRFEGYANSLVEAVACGIPSISVDWLLGSDEIIKDKYNGRIVHLFNRFNYAKGIDNDNDIINISKVINEMIEDPKECIKYSNNSVEILNSRDKDKIIEIWKKEIEGLINDDNK